MTRDRTLSDRQQELIHTENLTRLLSYRSLDELLGEALAILINSFHADGGSLLYVSTLMKRARQGELAGTALEQVNYLEERLCNRLLKRAWRINLPSATPVTRRVLADQAGILLTAPLFTKDHTYGSVSLFYETDCELDYYEELALGRLITNVCAIAANVETLVVTRQRLSQLGLFYQMGQVMTSTFDLTRLFQDTIELAVSVIDAQVAILRFLDRNERVLVHQISLGGTIYPEAQRVRVGKGIAGWVAQQGAPVLIERAREDPRFDATIDSVQQLETSSVLCVPLQIKGKVIGVLQVLNKISPSVFDEEDMSVLITLAAQASIALDNARLYHSLRAERDRIIEVQERTRHELARNLHDGPVQLMAAVAMRLDYLEHVIEHKPEDVHAEIKELRNLTRRATQDARMLLFELRPMILETQGLVSALQSYVDRLRTNERFQIYFDPGNFDCELDPGMAGTIFSIVQEAISNVSKHAGARDVWIWMRQDRDELLISIEDNGKGFDVGSVRANYDQGDSFGLLNMQERAELIDGVLTIKSGPKRGKAGTLVQLRIQVPYVEESRK